MATSGGWAHLAPVVWFFSKKKSRETNESFCFGLERDTTFYDLDLTSAYTTVLANAPAPRLESAHTVDIRDLERYCGKADAGFGYLIVDFDFKFPDHTKYPNLPVVLDNT